MKFRRFFAPKLQRVQREALKASDYPKHSFVFGMTFINLNITTNFTFSLRLKHVSCLQVVAAVTSDAPPFAPVVRSCCPCTPSPRLGSNTLWRRQVAAFVLSMLKINAAAWFSRRLHSVCTALLAFSQRAPRRSAIF